MQLPDTLMPELETQLKAYGHATGTYTLKNGMKYRAWWEGDEFKIEEVAD